MQKIDIEHQADEIGIDTSTLIDLYKLFLEQTENDIIELEAFISGKNVSKVKDTAHHVKGACLNLELLHMAELVREMEKKSINGAWDDISSLLKSFIDAFNDLKVFIIKE